jgi:hypothetical protein
MKSKTSPTHLIFTGIYFVLVIVTLIPNASASKASLLGYKALCSFVPWSAIILLGLAALHIYLYQKTPVK